MREIRFRAWDKGNKLMLQHYEFNYESLKTITDRSSYIPMQFTGILDKNGKEVYEGDLVKRKRFSTGKHLYTSRVVFRNGCFLLEPNTTMLEDYLYKYTNSYYGLEVIGHIYEELTSKS